MNTATKITYLVSVLLSIGASFVLEFREMAGMSLVILSIMVWERARSMESWRRQEERVVEFEARRQEEIAKRQADLDARTPGRGRKTGEGR